MPAWLMRAAVRRMEKRYNYDAAYLHDLLAVSPRALMAFSGVQKLAGYREGAPPDALAAAGLVATMGEDCGPCVQIGIAIAREQGVSPAVLRALLVGDEDGMGPDAALAWRFARASLARDLEAADPLREAVLARWGPKGLAAIALAMAASRVYPTVKYAMGHGKTCSRIEVDGESVKVAA